MPELRTAFHPPRVIREAAIARVAVQLSQLEEVLIPGTPAAGPEQPLLHKPPDARGRAVAKVLGSLGDRERPMLAPEALHRRTSGASATTSRPLACRRDGSASLDDLASPIVSVRLCRGGSPSGSADAFFAESRRLPT